MAKRLSSSRFTSKASASGASGPRSIDFGTAILPAKPIAYRKVAKKNA
jgi:hypothetical protein